LATGSLLSACGLLTTCGLLTARDLQPVVNSSAIIGNHLDGTRVFGRILLLRGTQVDERVGRQCPLFLRQGVRRRHKRRQREQERYDE
jgi:hypothetical protein